MYALHGSIHKFVKSRIVITTATTLHVVMTKIKRKMIVIEQLAASNSTVLNQQLNWGSDDWNREAELIKYLLSQTNECSD